MDSNELIAVAKTSQPIEKSFDKEVAIKFAAVLVFLGQDLSFSSDVKFIHITEEGKTVDDKEIVALPFNSYQKVSELKGQSFADIQKQYFIER